MMHSVLWPAVVVRDDDGRVREAFTVEVDIPDVGLDPNRFIESLGELVQLTKKVVREVLLGGGDPLD